MGKKMSICGILLALSLGIVLAQPVMTACAGQGFDVGGVAAGNPGSGQFRK